MTDLSGNALAILEGAAKPKKASPLPMIGVVAGLTLVALAGGAAVGLTLGRPAPAAPTAAPSPPEAAAPVAEDGPRAGDVILPIEPVVTNISSPVGAQVRLEASVLLRGGKGDALLAAQIQADTLVFLRTLELAQIEGARGLLHLREDLKERAQMRSPLVADYIIRQLVAQ